VHAFKLWGRHPGETVYIIGTGPSQRLFPLDFLADKTTIGLNQAWKHLNCTYSITVHPEHVWDYGHADDPKNATEWIVTSLKKRSAVRHKPIPTEEFPDRKKKIDVWYSAQHCEHYVFDPAYGAGALHDPALLAAGGSDNRLYQAHGVHNSAMWCAARMGASFIVLVGCDMTDLGAEHHAHEQHVRWCGADPSKAYKEYRLDAADTRRVLRERAGVRVMTMTPFMGCGHAEEDYARQKREQNLPDLPEPKDISPYRRPDLGRLDEKLKGN